MFAFALELVCFLPQLGEIWKVYYVHTTLVLKINLIVAPWAHHSHNKEKTAFQKWAESSSSSRHQNPRISVKDLFAASLLTSGHPSLYQELPAASLPASVPACLVWWCHCLCFVPDSAPAELLLSPSWPLLPVRCRNWQAGSMALWMEGAELSAFTARGSLFLFEVPCITRSATSSVCFSPTMYRSGFGGI